ncbi:hypothetical protein CTAYLR_009493 [Chrysophaeum taylorii]|uniref:BTB domain-containing protein n=1 Tax=Chrysophaeum taylorii TaxID=2483200 RepID=A0AAD7UI25_9STRA|nr:hypothetical protein CTAYLR_009493 [Chrysophaeum taylorii]
MAADVVVSKLAAPLAGARQLRNTRTGAALGVAVVRCRSRDQAVALAAKLNGSTIAGATVAATSKLYRTVRVRGTESLPALQALLEEVGPVELRLDHAGVVATFESAIDAVAAVAVLDGAVVEGSVIQLEQMPLAILKHVEIEEKGSSVVVRLPRSFWVATPDGGNVAPRAFFGTTWGFGAFPDARPICARLGIEPPTAPRLAIVIRKGDADRRASVSIRRLKPTRRRIETHDNLLVCLFEPPNDAPRDLVVDIVLEKEDMSFANIKSTTPTDATLYCADVPVRVHRAVLAARSGFFRAHFVDRKAGDLHLAEPQSRVLAMLAYMYGCDDLALEAREDALGLLDAAARYDVYGMAENIARCLFVPRPDTIAALIDLSQQRPAHPATQFYLDTLRRSCRDFLENDLRGDLDVAAFLLPRVDHPELKDMLRCTLTRDLQPSRLATILALADDLQDDALTRRSLAFAKDNIRAVMEDPSFTAFLQRRPDLVEHLLAHLA